MNDAAVTSNAEAAGSFQGTFALVFAFATDLLGRFREASAAAERTDAELVRAMHAGDDHAFDELYERYFDKIYAFVVRRVGHHQIAEDLVSDVFMKAFAHRQAFVWQVSFSAWIYRIATNRVTDYHRTKSGRAGSGFAGKREVELDETKHDQPSTVPHAPDEVDRAILHKKLETVLEKLPERERIAVTMKFYGECDNGEIARALKVTPNNVGVIVHRALKKCQATYE